MLNNNYQKMADNPKPKEKSLELKQVGEDKTQQFLQKQLLWPSDKAYSSQEKAHFYAEKKKYYQEEKRRNSPFIKRL